VNRKGEASARADALDQPIVSVRRERAAALSREHEGAVGGLPSQLAQRPNLVATPLPTRMAKFSGAECGKGGPRPLRPIPLRVGERLAISG
jgi:hypothetical protein